MNRRGWAPVTLCQHTPSCGVCLTPGAGARTVAALMFAEGMPVARRARVLRFALLGVTLSAACEDGRTTNAVGRDAALSDAAGRDVGAGGSVGVHGADAAPSGGSTPASDAGADVDGSVGPADASPTADAAVPAILTAPERTDFPTSAGSMHLRCRGAGRIAVVFLAGGADEQSTWSRLIAGLGRDVLTCTFDPPGVGASAAPDTLLTPGLVASALVETLAQAGVGERFLFVGHSLGGLAVRVLGGAHVERVAGAVLLDPTVPEMVRPEAAELRRFGFDPEATAAEGEAVVRWASDVPLSVLSHDPETARWPAELQAQWDVGQMDYARLSALGTQQDVPGTTHYVHVDAPEVVAAAIRAELDVLTDVP